MRASFLKAFFDVKLIVQNLTSDFAFAPGVADLELPSGLTLAPLPEPQALSQSVGAIPGGESRTIGWVVRGDTEGEYDLSATYSSVIDPIGMPVFLEARSRTPLKVWGASALKTQGRRRLARGALGAIRVRGRGRERLRRAGLQLPGRDARPQAGRARRKRRCSSTRPRRRRSRAPR